MPVLRDPFIAAKSSATVTVQPMHPLDVDIASLGEPPSRPSAAQAVTTRSLCMRPVARSRGCFDLPGLATRNC